MNLTNPALWARLETHQFDAAEGTLPFSGKLAQTEGWGAEDTERVVEEYRRFLYLARILEIEPAPPPAVDAAWRMHLTYTRDYWDRLVPRVLEQPLHRDAEALRLSRRRRAFYSAARRAYAHEFGQTPPRDIWQSPLQPDFGGLLVLCFLTGFAIALGGLLGTWGLGWLIGSPMGGAVDNGLERAGAVFFLTGWALVFFSPLWAWLISRALPHLRTTKKPPPGTTEIGISLHVSRP
ncbi:MAG: hypothetical protein AAF771_01395 [Pseudomonadota bacterium]